MIKQKVINLKMLEPEEDKTVSPPKVTPPKNDFAENGDNNGDTNNETPPDEDTSE